MNARQWTGYNGDPRDRGAPYLHFLRPEVLDRYLDFVTTQNPRKPGDAAKPGASAQQGKPTYHGNN